MTLFWLAAAWLLGIGLSTVAALDARSILVLSTLCAVFWLRLRSYRAPRWIFGLLLVASLGAARAAAVPGPTADDISQFNGVVHPVTVRGTVIDFPEARDRSVRLLIAVDSLAAGPEQFTSARGRLLAWVEPWSEWRYGDRVEVNGRLDEPPEFEGFSYRTYLARRGIYSVMQAAEASRLARSQGSPVLGALFSFRRQALLTVQQLFPEPEGSLLAGILLGVESGISEPVQAAFDATGTTHIIAISGFNISIIAGIFVHWMGRWLGARRGAWAAGVAVAAYTLLVGADAAVVRAAIMAGLALIARRVGRQQDGMAALGGSAFLMTLHRPHLLWDVGFQLSFAATLGLLLFSTPWQQAFEQTLQQRFGAAHATASSLSSALQDVVFVTLAAQLTTLPLSLYHFGRLSLAAPLANFIILPLQPATMILGGIATLAGMIWLPLGRVLAWVAWPFPALTIRVVETFAAQSWASLPLPPVGWPLLVLLYGLIFGLAPARRALARTSLSLPRIRLPAALSLGALAITALISWEAASLRPDGRLHLTVLDVGAEHAVLIRTPEGRNLLLNGGASALRLGEQLDRRISPLQRGLDWLVLLGGEEQTVAGLAGLIQRYPVGAALTAAQPESAAYTQLVEQLQSRGRPLVGAQPGTVLQLGAEASLETLMAGEDGAVVMLQHGAFRALIAHDTSAGWTEPLQAQGLPGDFTTVLLPASGDSEATGAADFAWLNPSLTLLAVQAGNRDGLPSPRLLGHLSDRTVLRTDEHGWITLATDGNQMWVEVQRAPAPP